MRRLCSEKLEIKYSNIYITRYANTIIDGIKNGASKLGVNYTKTMILTDILEYLYSVYFGSVTNYEELLGVYSDVDRVAPITNRVIMQGDIVFIYNLLFDEVAKDVHRSCVLDVYIKDMIARGVLLVCIDNREYTISELLAINSELDNVSE